jgi:hypothetical protein
MPNNSDSYRSKVDELLEQYGMTRENWECDPSYVADLMNALDSLSGPSEQDRKDAERYRVWRKEGVEYVWNARIREFAGDELDELTDKLIADRAFDPDYYDLT